MKRLWQTRRSSVLFFGALLACLIGRLPAATVVFQDGEVTHNVTVISQTENTIELKMPGGPVRFPRAAIKTIDGRFVNAPPAPSPAPSAAETLASDATPAAEQLARLSPDPPLPDEPRQNTAPTAEIPLVELPISAALPVAVVAAAPPGPVYEHRWNFEWILLGLLVIGGIWMRGLQWVQKDLYERQADPRFWALAALLLPGLGALIYYVTAQISDMAQRKRMAGSALAAGNSAAPGTAATKFSWKRPARDPAAHLAAKGHMRRGFEFLDTERKSIKRKGGADLNSGLHHAGEMLEEALLERASDVHIEPTSGDWRVRFRLDGLLHERMSYDADTGRRVVTSLKTLAEIDVAEKRKAQDGRFRVRSGDREVDFRVATTNSLHGEKMVIRILDHQGGVFDLTSLGMSDEMLATFQSVIHSRNGMILATGPTGAGKTSTLYAALRQLDSSRKNIMTIEDPPEYELAGATQLTVNPKAGVTYESGLRSILRQDPDVILVGEMRDTEAARVALRAALTGHLVLSSLHTKDAVGTIARLQDMGIERYQVASGLLMVLAQRLVRVLCPRCRKPYGAEGSELETLGLPLEPGTTIYSAGSCDHCLGTGFKGRTGLFELLVMDENIRRAVGEGIGEAALEVMIVEKGFRSYRFDGAEKIIKGITTVEEVLQAV
ncbi:MAG: GspE/PulE family protein [Verrucomicrobiota bacterium]